MDESKRHCIERNKPFLTSPKCYILRSPLKGYACKSEAVGTGHDRGIWLQSNDVGKHSRMINVICTLLWVTNLNMS